MDRSSSQRDQRDVVRAALRALGIENLVLSIHDASFPSATAEDTGRGSPYTEGGRAFASFVAELGFDGLQFGPQGQTSLGNASPYDGSVFSKSVLSIALSELAEPTFAKVLDPRVLTELVVNKPAGDSHAHYAYAYVGHQRALALASANLRARANAGDAAALALATRIQTFASRASWLGHDSIFEALATEHGTDDWRRWPEADRAALGPARRAELEARHRDVIDAWLFGQFVLDAQHDAFREHVSAQGLALYGDLQIGLSLRDTWSRGALFLSEYVMGAPPSRTNPEGQPWGYPVFDPRTYDANDGPIAFLTTRMNKIFAEFDGVRIDHPHGLVCPWVYDAKGRDDAECVARGARLFESPSDPLHPALALYAIARPEQLDPRVPAYADERVHDLEPSQVDAYDRLFDVVVRSAMAHGRKKEDILCEVLSTCPLPLRAVMARHDLGRFRVTQKASMTNPDDGYRSEHAEPHDWVMIGNHDTEPLLLVCDRWGRSGSTAVRASYLAERLASSPSRRERLARTLEDPTMLVLAMFAELFASRARHVLVFFADLFGSREVYNMPGVVREENWTLRVPQDYRTAYRTSLERGEALDLPAALAAAMRARGDAFTREHAQLLTELDARSVIVLDA
ncbi:4-alpha-glucanotransferase (amylomaltase) [Labilithrix luteola]|uniref:4-alpha-glucanotransferase n=1 Tax=Labilithrix luteola TaxID=1391654 RepID=A0A0K1Q4T9_9BACT|nr:4-alpha-glucanotransferase [Labilithrix luteola]AKV00724.1 4-alpha-glucanotransferase (amylomaltase) [Labilithrix luteola]